MGSPPIHTCFVKRTSMLHAISWKEFFTLLSFGLILYYGWLIMKYFPAATRPNGARGRKSMDETISAERAPADGKGPEPESGSEPEKTESGPTAEASQLDLPSPEEGRKSLKELAEALCSEVTALLEQAEKGNMPRGQVVLAV